MFNNIKHFNAIFGEHPQDRLDTHITGYIKYGFFNDNNHIYKKLNKRTRKFKSCNRTRELLYFLLKYPIENAAMGLKGIDLFIHLLINALSDKYKLYYLLLIEKISETFDLSQVKNRLAINSPFYGMAYESCRNFQQLYKNMTNLLENEEFLSHARILIGDIIDNRRDKATEIVLYKEIFNLLDDIDLIDNIKVNNKMRNV